MKHLIIDTFYICNILYIIADSKLIYMRHIIGSKYYRHTGIRTQTNSIRLNTDIFIIKMTRSEFIVRFDQT